jgi:1,4-alpha-glucan branching enzyme
MLMSSSDWQFLISTFAARDYGELRLTEHFADFEHLAELADRLIAGENATEGDRQFLADCHQRDNLFEDLELDWFAAVEFPAH